MDTSPDKGDSTSGIILASGGTNVPETIGAISATGGVCGNDSNDGQSLGQGKDRADGLNRAATETSSQYQKGSADMVTGGTSGDQNTERQILATGAAIQSIKLADGRLWRLKPLNLNMLMEVEEKCGKFDMATAASMKLLRYILFVRLKPYADGGLTEEQVGELVDAEVLKNLKGILET